jgi:hypothetical protein
VRVYEGQFQKHALKCITDLYLGDPLHAGGSLIHNNVDIIFMPGVDLSL